VYSEQPIDGHLAVFQGRPDALAYIRSVNPDYVWLPKSLPVMAELQSTGEWTTTFDGPMSAVLARTPQLERLDPGSAVARSDHPGSRFFPGP
jgi:hypothetical protein